MMDLFDPISHPALCRGVLAGSQTTLMVRMRLSMKDRGFMADGNFDLWGLIAPENAILCPSGACAVNSWRDTPQYGLPALPDRRATCLYPPAASARLAQWALPLLPAGGGIRFAGDECTGLQGAPVSLVDAPALRAA